MGCSMNQRWYDRDPTLSMAVSLLQNASKTHQEMTARYVNLFLEREHLMEKHLEMEPGKLQFLFPFMRRNRLEKSAWSALETIKRLPKDVQLEVALAMINYIYILDAGGAPPTVESVELPLAAPDTP